jgi:hypothetical protein
MQQYILTVIEPAGDPPPAADLERIMSDMRAVNEELRAAGAWVFSAGLGSPDSATVVKVRDGETLMTDGPYLEGKEHIGGFTIIRADDLDAALEWARRYAGAATLPIEVRPVEHSS